MTRDTISIIIQTFLIVSTVLTVVYASKKIAVVTGANKGIGYAIVKELCAKFDGDVFLTSRNEAKGLAAVKSLNELGYKPKFYLLDVTDQKSIERLRNDIISRRYGGLDILVNNAGIMYKEGMARETMQVNYFGLRDTCKILFSILKPGARVVNLSGAVCHLSNIPDKNLRNILASPDLTEENLSTLMTSFVEAAENGTQVEKGWPKWAYTASKVGVAALTRIQQRELKKDLDLPNILVNHVHPGYVKTDLSNHTGKFTIEEGAQVPVYLALLPENCTSPQGDFVWSTKEIIDWVNGPIPKN